ncbi:hypothetical protein KR018_008833, partial [Drosophila ironensis]
AIIDMERKLDQWNSNKFRSVTNSVSNFALIRHMQSDWIHWQLFLEKDHEKEEIYKLRKSLGSLPSQVDLDDASNGIADIMDIYELDPKDIAKGLLAGKQYNTSLSARDCFEIGNHKSSIPLLEEAISLLQSPGKTNQLDPIFSLDVSEVYLAQSDGFLKKGNWSKALTALDDGLKVQPRNAKLLKSREHLGTHLLFAPPETPNVNISSIHYYCCQAECRPERNRDLHCLYLRKKESAFLQLAPIKTEILHRSPFIVYYHDVLSHDEMKDLRTFSASHLRPKLAKNNSESGKKGEKYQPKSHFVWLKKFRNKGTDRAIQFLEDATGLNVTDSESFQVINYGIGGSLENHLDSSLNHRKYLKQERMATAIFYVSSDQIICTQLIGISRQLSEVPQGGATMFRKLNLSIFPKPGSVLFWYNLNNAGDTDPMTEHSGCPVIVGSKW